MSKHIVTLTLAGLLVSVGPAFGATITVADIVTNCGYGLTNSCTWAGAGATVTSQNGNITYRLGFGGSDPTDGFGVGGGVVNEEIDSNESITIYFDAVTTLDSLELVFLYQPTAYGDLEPGETAVVEGFLGATSLGTAVVDVTASNTATTTMGTVSNTSAGNENFGGAWLLSSPFGSNPIDRLVFYPFYPGDTPAYSDFSIGTVTFVPEPALLALLGTGLVAISRRRRRRA